MNLEIRTCKTENSASSCWSKVLLPSFDFLPAEWCNKRTFNLKGYNCV